MADYGSDYFFDGGYGGGDSSSLCWVYLKSSMHGKVIDVENANQNAGAMLNMYDQKGLNENANQLFYIDESTQTIRSRLNDFCIDLNADGYACLNPYDSNAESQLWTLNGPKIEHVSTGKVLDIYDGDSWDGAKLCIYDYGGNENQHWAVEPIAE